MFRTGHEAQKRFDLSVGAPLGLQQYKLRLLTFKTRSCKNAD